MGLFPDKSSRSTSRIFAFKPFVGDCLRNIQLLKDDGFFKNFRMATMKALVMGKTAVLADSYPMPVRESGEALVRVRRSGICNTDLELMKGFQGFQGVLGHEFVGEVAEVDDGAKFKVGQRVVAEINTTCGNCEYCDLGGVIKRNHCSDKKVVGILSKDGCHAQYLSVPVNTLFPVPDSISDEQACFVEPLAAAFRIIEQGLIKPTDTVALIGDGKLSQLIGQVIQGQAKQRFVVFGKHASKLALLGEAQETALVTDSTGKEFSNTFDVVVDACGTPSGMLLAQEIARPLGTVVLKTTCAASPSFNTVTYVIKELTIVGSRCGNFSMALQALEEGSVIVEHLLHKTFPLEESMAALEEAGKRGVMKVQLIMS